MKRAWFTTDITLLSDDKVEKKAELAVKLSNLSLVYGLVMLALSLVIAVFATGLAVVCVVPTLILFVCGLLLSVIADLQTRVYLGELRLRKLERFV